MTTAIFYATREGQTRRIAHRITDDLRARGVQVDVFNVNDAPRVTWSKYSSACVAASVHAGRHEREMIAFVRTHRADLERLGAAFISVTLSAANAQDPARSGEVRQHAAADVQRMIDVFVKATGWRPAHVLPVAGALQYTRYNVLMRFMMKRIARQAGGPTDTSRDYEFTDWAAIDKFSEALATGLW